VQKVELLAPARDLECGLTALRHGADAVYIGAEKFGAREKAGNSLRDIEVLVRNAHKYWARVYLTLNTLLRDAEIPRAVELAWKAFDAGIDGLIIQDAGLLECDLPPLPLIASTQMHNHTPARVAFLEKVGFHRAILARELTLDQIRAIRRETRLELEFFVHGALCVCYSGQCTMSYALGGRSGNRGDCAQPCRKNYSLLDRWGNTLLENRCLLSLKDLNLSGSLEELLDAGVTSFKIEGRLKDKAYVSNVVAHYRQRLDAILDGSRRKRSSSGKSFFDFQPAVEKTFNRDFTRYFLYDRQETVGSTQTPKMRGELIGQIGAMDQQSFTLLSGIPLQRGDGICFFDAQGELAGTGVNKVQGQRVFPDRMDHIRPGLLVYRNHDHVFLQRLEKSRTARKLGISLSFRETEAGFTLQAVDEDGVQAETSLAIGGQTARKQETVKATLEKQLTKLGGTDFYCQDFENCLSQAFFFPVSRLNALRRELLQKLETRRIEFFPKLSGQALRNQVPFPEIRLDCLGNVLNQKAEQFYRRHGVLEIEPAAESGLEMAGCKVMTTRHCLLHELGWCNGREKLKSPELPLTLVDGENHRLELKFCCDRCEMEIYYSPFPQPDRIKNIGE
jgi:putative protease